MLNTLQELLERMNEHANVLESIIVKEQEAAHQFDGDALIGLMEQRIHAYGELAELEERCKALLIAHGASEDMTLEAFIDLYAGSEKTQFQSLRRELYERMLHVEKGNSDNRIRLHAAYDVTTNVLKHVGVMKQKQTYGPSELK